MKASCVELPGRLVALLVAILAACLLTSSPVRAQSFTPPETCIAKVEAGDTASALLAAPGRFVCDKPQHRFGPGDYWLRITLPVGTDGLASPMLLFRPNYLERAVVYAPGANGALQTTTLSPTAISRLTQVGARVELPISAETLKAGQLLIRIEGATNTTGLISTPQLLDAEASHRIELVEMAIYAAFAGLGLALLVYNLVFWLTMRERFQLVYCGSVVAMLIYAGLHSGLFDMLFPDLGANWRSRLNYLALGTMAVLALWFIAEFLPRCAIPNWLRRSITLVSLAILVASLAVPIVSTEYLFLVDRCYVMTFLPVPPLAVALCIYGWKHDREAVRVLVLAWSLPIAMAVVRILHSLNFLENSSLIEHSVVYAMSFEALLSSFAVSLRVRHILGERDLARAEESAARRLSEIDPLTGLQNRRALLANAVNMAPGAPLRLLLVDIDFFKSINDTYGHEVGDEVLREVASVLARSLEIRGTAARMGGEEFALLGPADDIADDLALDILAQIRAAVMPEGIRITVSIGSAVGSVGQESDWRDLYRRADAALYDAKRTGRNCHVAGQAARIAATSAAA